jgi:hypothetical protein
MRPYVEVTLEDIEVANRLAHEVLGRTLDELPPQTRRFLTLLLEMVTRACQERKVEQPEYLFSRADIRRYTGWSLTQVKVHLDRLVEMEYVLVHRGGRGSSFVYELLYSGEGDDGATFLMGLLDVATLRQRPPLPRAYDANLSAFEQGVSGSGQGMTDPGANLSGSKRGQNGALSGGCRGAQQAREPNNGRAFPALAALEPPESTSGGVSPEPTSSYVGDRRSAAEPAVGDTPPPARGAAAQPPPDNGEADEELPSLVAAGQRRA